MKSASSKNVGFLFIAIAAVIWGSNGVIVNNINLSPIVLVFFRVFFASLFLSPYIFLKSKLEQVSKAWKNVLIMGILLSLGWGFLFQSMKLIAIGNAVLLNYTGPVFVALLAPILLKESIQRSTLIAMSLSLAGIILISSQQELHVGDLNFLGVVFGLLASLAYAGFIIISKRTLIHTKGQILAFWAYLVCAICLSPSLIGANLSVDFNSWMFILLLGLINTAFAVTLYLKGLKLIETQKAVIFTYLEPVSSIIFGSLFLAQEPTLFMLLGGSLIIVAGYIAASK